MDGELTPDAQAGVTLIELVIVVAVLATLAVGVSLAAGRPASGAESDMARFVQSYALNRGLAVQGRQRRGLVITRDGSQRARWRDGAWEVAPRTDPWRGPVSYLIEGVRTPDGAPNILFLPNGRTSAFTITFDTTRCHSDGWTGLTCDAG